MESTEPRNTSPLHEVRSKIPTANNAVLDSYIAWPKDTATHLNVAVVVTHPYSLLGGNMNNNVVYSVAHRLAWRGFTTVRFNFRGVGKSSGWGSWRGSAEQQDVLSVCKYLLRKDENDSSKKDFPKIDSVILVGYSYGSVISSSVINEMEEIIGFVAISYPFGVLFWLLLWHLPEKCKTTKPSLFIMGTSDNFTRMSTFNNKMIALKEAGPAETLAIEDIDHFWFGQEINLSDAVYKWINEKVLNKQDEK